MTEPQLFNTEPTVDKTENEIVKVFDYWVAACRNRPTVVKLGDKRKRTIQKAIRLYGTDMCLQAIDGILNSPWHQGDNPTGTTYDDITLILRNEETIERFANLAQDPIENWLNE